MAKYHINPETGNANVCTATIKCKFTSDDGVEPPHYGTKQDAQKASEQQLSSTLPTIQTLKNTVEIKEPVGDPRSLDAISGDIVQQNKKVEELSEEFTSDLRNFQKGLEDYDAAVKSGAAYDSRKMQDVYTSANLAIRKVGISRENLLTARSQLHEEHLVREQKIYPKRAFERGVTLAALQPMTRDGRQILSEMKKTLEDSEKELALSKRATDNLVNRHEHGNSQGSNSTKTSFAQINDTIEQSDRMIRHARAVKRISELAQDYRKAEGQSWRGRVSLDPLDATPVEKMAAAAQTPSQIAVYSRITSGLDQNHINQRYMDTIEAVRKKTPTGSDERKNLSQVLKRHRDNVKYNQKQYENSIIASSDTAYRGFISRG